MSVESAMVVSTQENKIDFYGDEITTVTIGGEVFVMLLPITKYLGLNWPAQLQRLKRDDALSQHIRNVSILDLQSRQRRNFICLQLEYLPGWLFGMAPSRVKPELAPKLRRYREECFQTLWRMFQSGLVAMPEVDRPETNKYEVVNGVAERIREQRRRAEHIGLPATLTVEEWL